VETALLSELRSFSHDILTTKRVLIFFMWSQFQYLLWKSRQQILTLLHVSHNWCVTFLHMSLRAACFWQIWATLTNLKLSSWRWWLYDEAEGRGTKLTARWTPWAVWKYQGLMDYREAASKYIPAGSFFILLAW